jgi:DNA-binding transcriptional MerR regulator
MASHHPIRKTVAKPAPAIPDKLYFRIGDVASLCEVPAYVLRFWETEFPHLKPNKSGTGQRLYRRKEVETALRIKHLLYDLGYTIPGARQVFKSEAASKDSHPPQPEALAAQPARSTAIVSPISGSPVSAQERITDPRLVTLRDELRALHAQLSEPLSQRKPMRPRLVIEPRSRAVAPLPIESAIAPLQGQQALFPVE